MAKMLPQYKTANMAACFVAFINGSSLEDIAVQFQVGERNLKDTARVQGWANLALAVQETSALQGEDLNVLEILRENRVENLKQAVRLREEIDETINRVTANGAFSIAPTVLKELAHAAAQIHDLTYRALGDKEKQQKPGEGSAPAPAHISIHLPPAIAQPRGVVNVTPGNGEQN